MLLIYCHKSLCHSHLFSAKSESLWIHICMSSLMVSIKMSNLRTLICVAFRHIQMKWLRSLGCLNYLNPRISFFLFIVAVAHKLPYMWWLLYDGLGMSTVCNEFPCYYYVWKASLQFQVLCVVKSEFMKQFYYWWSISTYMNTHILAAWTCYK